MGSATTERVLLWNECAGQIFGYTEVEALQLRLHDLVPPRLRDLHRRGLAGYRERGTGTLLESGKPVQLWGLHKDGHEVPIELTLTAIPEDGPAGERYALAIVRDATDRLVAEEGRRRLERADLKRQQALELNDGVVQGLVVAKAALELGKTDEAMSAVSQTLAQAKRIVSGLLSDIAKERDLQPGDLIREDAAVVQPDDKTNPPPPGVDVRVSGRIQK